MKNLLISFLIIGYIFTCSAQHGAKAKSSKPRITLAQHSVIDNLSTAESVEQLLGAYDPMYKDFKVNASLTFSEKAQTKLGKKLRAKPWVKADFDSNGCSDLLVMGIWNGIPAVLCVLDSGENRYAVKQVAGKPGENCFLAVVKFGKGQPVITAWYQDTKREKSGKLIKRTAKTALCFQSGDLIEYNSSPANHSIEKIEFKTFGCRGRCPVFTLVINADRTANLDAGKFTSQKGNFRSTLNDTSFNSLMALLRCIDFAKLDSAYRVIYMDAASCQLTFTYDGGKIKRVSDYGMKGTFGLKKLYDVLNKLRETQNWE